MIKPNNLQISIPNLLKIGENEFKNIGKYLLESKFSDIAIFWSPEIDKIFGPDIYKSLKDANINIVKEMFIEEIDIETIVTTAFSIPKRVKVLIGIGGGKALDYCKYTAHVLALPFVSIPTSTSNDGFCSPTSSLLVGGKRKSVNSTIPYGIIVDINSVATSPESCIFSGIGDLISKITAGWDWKKSCLQNGEKFNDFAYLISQNTVTEFLNYQNYSIRSAIFTNHLVTSLLMNGISMEIAGSSRPASGSEHLISHALDSITIKPNMHGIQVGIATYICSYLQNNQFELVKNFLENTGFFNYLKLHPLNKTELIEAIKIAPSVKEDFYTILSEPDSYERAVKFIENDPYMQKVLIPTD
ncbi:MAG: iron-containing alcohol dehydrogenase family protein [bacterium]